MLVVAPFALAPSAATVVELRYNERGDKQERYDKKPRRAILAHDLGARAPDYDEWDDRDGEDDEEGERQEAASPKACLHSAPYIGAEGRWRYILCLGCSYSSRFWYRRRRPRRYIRSRFLGRTTTRAEISCLADGRTAVLAETPILPIRHG